MANTKSQMKRNRQNLRRRDANRAVRSELKTREKAAFAALAAGPDQATDGPATDAAVRLAQKRIDMAAAKGVIHKNEAARRKSRLMKAHAS